MNEAHGHPNETGIILLEKKVYTDRLLRVPVSVVLFIFHYKNEEIVRSVESRSILKMRLYTT